MNEFLQTGPHPDADQLSAFAEHTLPQHERQQTLAHLAECAACRQIVALSLPPLVESPAPVRQRWFSGWRLAWAAVPALVVLMLGFFLVRERGVAPHQTAATVQQVPLPQMEARSAAASTEPALVPEVPSFQHKRRVSPAKPDAPLIPPADELAKGAPGGAMGGILGGIGAAPSSQLSAPKAGAAPSNSFASMRGQFAAIVPARLPSGLPAISIASRRNQRLAIDSNHTVFFSDNEGRDWKAVPSQWNGRAVQVALTTPPVKPQTSAVTSEVAPAGVATARFSGTVTDPTGAVIQGATVTAFEPRGDRTFSGVTDREGVFRMEQLPSGSYRIEAEAPGFKKRSVTVDLLASTSNVVNLTLAVASASQTVNVQSGPSALDSLSGGSSSDLPPFEMTTDDGSHWTSADGQTWSRR